MSERWTQNLPSLHFPFHKCQGLPNSDISGYQHCMSQTKGGLRSSVHGCFYFSVQLIKLVKLLSDCLENHWLPWPILELRTIMWNVTCEWPPERTKQREVTTHTAILNSVTSPFDLRSSFLLYYFSTISVYTKFTRQVWISQIFVCLRLFTRDSSFFQKQDNVWIIWLMGTAPSCAICLVPPVNEKSHCVQSQQASKPQSELWSDPSGSLCHSPAKSPAIMKSSPWRLFQF